MRTKEEVRNEIIKLFDKNGSITSFYTRESYLKKIGLLEDILAYSHEGLTIRERMWEILLRIEPTCIVCGKLVKLSADAAGGHFYHTCSTKCMGIAKLGKSIIRDEQKASEKRKQTMLEKYGYTTNSQRPDIKKKTEAKRIKTLKKKYGPAWNSVFWKESLKTWDKKHPGEIHPWLNPPTRSKGEEEVAQEIEKLGITVMRNDWSQLDGKELDIYIPSKKFAVEYCGEFWHSEKGRPDKLHLFEKWKECKEKDIQLVCIFESEWINRKYQIMNLLRSKLVPALKIPARKCEFVKLASVDAKNFINRHHIQPITIMGDYTYGLVYNSEIVAVMTFRLHHRNSKEIVLNRFCCIDGISITGGASKLLHNAMKLNDWNKVISWSDNRWSNGNLYKQLGFQLKMELKPDYMYWDGQKMLSKQSCTKKALKARSDQTESQRAEELGLCKIWDCGKQSWTFEQATSSLLMPYRGKIIVEKPIIKAPYIPLF